MMMMTVIILTSCGSRCIQTMTWGNSHIHKWFAIRVYEWVSSFKLIICN